MEPKPHAKDTIRKKEIEIRRFFVEANPQKIRCVDERHADDQTNGVQIQGGTSGLVDAYKKVKKVSEYDAWQAIVQAGVPLGGHTDTHLGNNGCGYNNQVENDPSSVGAPQSAISADRVNRIRSAGGDILNYEGNHNPRNATINYVAGSTLDTNRILDEGQGTFNLDAWVLDEFASLLKLTAEETNLFKTYVIDSYMQTIKTLTKETIATFIELR